MPAADTVRVEGLRDLNRAFSRADRKLQTELRTTLREVAEPVRADAERLAKSGIPRIGVPWSQMRVGVTAHSVYIAPKRRGGKGARRRPNLAGLLLGRSMLPAIDKNRPQVVRGIERMLDEVGRTWER